MKDTIPTKVRVKMGLYKVIMNLIHALEEYDFTINEEEAKKGLRMEIIFAINELKGLIKSYLGGDDE